MPGTIYQRLHAVMTKIGYVQKNASTGSSNNAPKGVARDEVVAQIRAALLDAGVIASTTQVAGSGRFIETTQKSSSGTPLSVYVGTYATSFIATDLPTDGSQGPWQHVVEHEAQGNDYGDKAPGKAATYAEKLNFVKGLMLETGIGDESRNPGEGDDEPEKPAAKPAASAPKEPKGKEPDKPAESRPAGKGLVKQIKETAEAKGKLANVEAAMEKAGMTWDTLTADQAKSLWKKLSITEQREPGEEG